jgi:peptide/nickel transport system substrate-binding protein
MRLIGTVVGVCVIATVMSGCGGSSDSRKSGSASSASSHSLVVKGATFTLAMAADPGALDPQMSAASNTFQMTQFAYDNLVNADAKGKIESGLATAWQVNGPKIVLTIHKAVTCADGSPFTAADAAANINFIADPLSKSPFLGVFLPGGSRASADAAAGTVTLTTPKVAPFVLNGLANLPMVCAKGMSDRKTLARHTDGTGAYQLSEAASGDHYTYTVRSGYSWGPNGATTATEGLPSKIVVKIVPNETTAANLLLSGGLSAATILGADTQRLEAAQLFSADVNAISGEMWFNHANGRPTADEAVRQAMTSALDLTQMAKVLTSGRGRPGTTFAAFPPTACPGNSVAAALPAHDLAKAKQLLDTAGWRVGTGGLRTKNGTTLSAIFVYNTAQGSAGSAAAELAAAAWKQLGIKVTMKPQDETAINATIFSTGNWDVSWEGLNVSSPDQIVPFMSGPVPPNGTNFAHIDNAAYTALVTTASALDGSEGCGDWLKAESELVKAADVFPFANQVTKTFGSHTSFTIAGELVPTSIRMLAK